MKEINGTISLAYVEEDNKQRVIFRVIPLCTREGSVFHGGAEDFPDVGSLRIVPDKREQSTFKERMREIGGLCVVHLLSEGKELMKVRQNRNYAPDQGENNRLAIYSDVICEFTEGGCYEVVELGTSAESALTEKVLLHKDKVLYGPVERSAAQDASAQTLKPFGNDHFLLHTVGTPDLGTHLIYWDPEATLSWRQRRGSLRRREKPASGEADEGELAVQAPLKTPQTLLSAPQGAMAEEAPILESVSTAQTFLPQTPEAEESAKSLSKPTLAERPGRLRMSSRTRHSEPIAVLPQQSAPEGRKAAEPERTEKAEAPGRAAMPAPSATVAPPEAQETVAPFASSVSNPPAAGEPLPIGTRLEILDAELPFDQQISRLAQPLSDGANRLSSEAEAEEDEPGEVVARFSGTPLLRPAVRITRTAARPEPMHHVIDQQIRGRRNETMAAEIGENAYDMVDNPIENLQSCMEYVWQNADMREQAMDALMQNESFVRDMLRAFRHNGMNTQAVTAAQEQLAEIEAERLSLLMQLDSAKENEKKYREEAIASLARKRREEAEGLEREVKRLEATRKELQSAAQTLSEGVAAQTTDFLAAHMRCLTGAGEQRVLLCPVLGCHYSQQELAEKLRVHMNDSGFSLNEDDAMSLLINFSLYDALCLRGLSVADAQLFAQVLLESLGLQSVSALVMPGAYVEMISLLPEDGCRTPTITVQPLGTETMAVYGHKTLFLADLEDAPEESVPFPYPTIVIPQLSKRAFGRAAEWAAIPAAALSSFSAIQADVHPMLDEAEKWFESLKRELAQTELHLPDAMLLSMRRFIEVASRKIRGGFLAAADIAMCYWVVPLLTMRKEDMQKLSGALSGLPRALERLGIR